MTPPQNSLPPIEERLSFLVHRINAQMARICNPMFRHLKVDILMSRMLVILLEKGPLPAGELVRIMALPQSTISHQLKRIDKLKYIERSVDKADSRSIIVSLTPLGRKTAKKCNELSREVTGLLLQALGDADVDLVRDALKRMDSNLAEYRSIDF
jgi:DNA-binding MarR family transcriptional regulator